MLMEAYEAGVRDFGENYVQELTEKQPAMPGDVHWHFIGHLQSNKVKYIAPFVHLIHAVDSEKLLAEIQKQAAKNLRTIDVLLQVHVAHEETKFGWDPKELQAFAEQFNATRFPNVRLRGLMAMASFTEDQNILRNEFQTVKQLFDALRAGAFAHQESFDTLSMGMSGDWPLAVQQGSTMIRVGSAIFGNRKP